MLAIKSVALALWIFRIYHLYNNFMMYYLIRFIMNSNSKFIYGFFHIFCPYWKFCNVSIDSSIDKTWLRFHVPLLEML